MAAAEGEKKMTSFIAKSSGAEEFEAGAIRRAIEDDCDDDDSGILPPDVLSGEGLDNRDAGFPPSQRSASKITGDRAAVNPAAADPPMPVPGLHHHPNIPAANRQLPPAARLLINCGIFLVATAGSSIVFHTAGDPSAIDGPAYALVAFLFVLLGLWFVLLGPVAGQFPGATRVAVAIAKALKGYLLGGGN
ncbi:uncharacterized protein LOC127753897 [Oryza glaberrima]|uniref:Uncharacterized protein n=3 Tax=Oryza TaxID=4527 RepID=A0A0D3HLJ7_9ORYZ|nr:uncharacterized protein LOC127753897 [Oryza glaberrima]